MLTPTTVLHRACPCLPQLPFSREHTHAYPNHRFASSMPMLTPTTVLQRACPCLHPTTVLQRACPCLRQPPFFADSMSLHTPNHHIAASMPLLTPTTVNRYVALCGHNLYRNFQEMWCKHSVEIKVNRTMSIHLANGIPNNTA